jgi:predicted DNA-binding transcriptional regulator AlpA
MAYVVIADPSFPKPKAIGPRLRVWMKDEIEEWLRSRPAGKPARLPHLHGGGPPKAA